MGLAEALMTPVDKRNFCETSLIEQLSTQCICHRRRRLVVLLKEGGEGFYLVL